VLLALNVFLVQFPDLHNFELWRKRERGVGEFAVYHESADENTPSGRPCQSSLISTHYWSLDVNTWLRLYGLEV
jgi:hypothetical protein